MNRPSSIVMFERFYLGSLAVWLIGLIVFWQQFQDRITMATAHYPAKVAALAPYMTWGSIVFAIGIPLLLWYFTARRASLTASWIVIILEALGTLSVLLALIRLASGHGPGTPSDYVNLLSSVLAIVAAVFLLRPDARAWLSGSRREPRVETL